MKKFFVSSFLTLAVASSLMITACEKKEDTTGPEGTGDPITDTNLFPYIVGTRIAFTKVTLDTNNTAIAESAVRRGIATVSQVSIGGKTALMIVDTTYEPSGTEVDTVYLNFDNGNMSQYDDTYGWMVMFDKAKGSGVTYTMYEQSMNQGGYSYSIKVTGKIHPKENVQTSLGTFSAYKLEFVTNSSYSYMGQSESFTNTQYFYIANNVGIVQFYSPSQKDPSGGWILGERSLIIEKSF